MFYPHIQNENSRKAQSRLLQYSTKNREAKRVAIASKKKEFGIGGGFFFIIL